MDNDAVAVASSLDDIVVVNVGDSYNESVAVRSDEDDLDTDGVATSVIVRTRELDREKENVGSSDNVIDIVFSDEAVSTVIVISSVLGVLEKVKVLVATSELVMVGRLDGEYEVVRVSPESLSVVVTVSVNELVRDG